MSEQDAVGTEQETDEVTRTVSTPTDPLTPTLARAAALDPDASAVVDAHVADGELVVELEGERL